MLESFPLAALGGLVAYAAIRLIDVGEMHRIARFRRSEAVIADPAYAGLLLSSTSSSGSGPPSG